MIGAGAREADFHERLDCGFDQSQSVSGDGCAGSVIGGLVVGMDNDWRSAERASDSLRGEASGRGAFDRKNHAVETGSATAGEGLHRMHRACECAATGEWRENAMVEGTAGVKDDFAAGLLLEMPHSDSRKFLHHALECIIRNRQQDYIGIEHFRRERSVRRSGTDGANCGARASAGTCDNCADSPTKFVEAPRDGLTDATGADDGNCARHCSGDDLRDDVRESSATSSVIA